jgi:hypothetical protein
LYLHVEAAARNMVRIFLRPHHHLRLIQHTKDDEFNKRNRET